MTQLIPFEGSQLPAHLINNPGVTTNDELSSGVGVSYPLLSIKGKVWHLVQGEDRKLLTQPGTEDPLSALEVAIIAANPALSKVYYSGGYVEGSADKPECFSNDGVAPDASVEQPQSPTCAMCPQNVWGSKISENGSKVKACADSRRIAVAPLSQLNSPMMLRVPAASLKPMAQYSLELKKRGAPVTSVLTKIGFDYTVAHPQLTFRAVGFLSAEQYAEVMALRSTPIVQQIIGTAPTVVEAPALPAAPAAPPQQAVAAVKERGKPGRKPKAVEPAPVAAAPAVAPAAPVAAPSAAAISVDSILSGLGIDD
jgi:hypothetical protein